MTVGEQKRLSLAYEFRSPVHRARFIAKKMFGHLQFSCTKKMLIHLAQKYVFKIYTMRKVYSTLEIIHYKVV